MKTLFLTVLAVISVESAELYISSSNSPPISIATNEAILLHYVRASAGIEARGVFTANGQTNLFYFVDMDAPMIVAGPGSLALTPAVASVTRLQKVNSSTFFLRSGAGVGRPRMDVPSGQTCRLYATFGGRRQYIMAKLTIGASAVDAYFKPGDEIPGPARIDFIGTFGVDGGASLITCVLNSDFTAQPELGQIQAAGNVSLAVEQSEDLKNWRPTILHHGTSIGNNFYRLQMSK